MKKKTILQELKEEHIEEFFNLVKDNRYILLLFDDISCYCFGKDDEERIVCNNDWFLTYENFKKYPHPDFDKFLIDKEQKFILICQKTKEERKER